MARFRMPERSVNDQSVSIDDLVELREQVGSRRPGTCGSVRWVGERLVVIDFDGRGVDGMDVATYPSITVVSEAAVPA